MRGRLGPYEILAPIGSGGMGEVYRARDHRLDRIVAIKVLSPSYLQRPDARSRFDHEARAVAALDHPHICALYDIGHDEGVDFLVMPYLEGETLAARLGRGALPLAEARRYATEIAEAIEAAHRRGVTHRDLKPSNIMLTRSGAVLLDFGLAKLSASERSIEEIAGSTTTDLTREGVILGTIRYMAPEVLERKAADARSDLFSFGVIVYEMVTGRPAFPGDSEARVIAAILNDDPPPLTTICPDAPAALDALVRTCLAKDPDERWQNAGDVVRQLVFMAGTSFAAEAIRKQEITGQTRSVSLGAPSAAAIPLNTRSHHYAWIAGSVFVAVLAGLWLGRGVRGRVESGATTVTAPSIAVLPFEDLSPTRDQEYFTDGLAEELLNALARIPELRVAARTSSFQFSGKTPIAEIGRQLHVGAILEGSVRKAGRRVRITAQLVNVANGFNLWSETYDRELDDIFAVQDDIARSVSGALRVRLLGPGTSRAATSASVEAYTLYLQARYFYDRRGREALDKAVSYYEQALKLDAGLASAWVGLADARRAQANSGYVPLHDAYRTAREEVNRALQLDPNLAEAHAALGRGLMAYEWDWLGADAAFKRALELEPGSASAARWAATLAGTLGRMDEAIRLDRRAIELDPLSVRTHLNLGMHSLQAGRLDEADAAFSKVLELNPEYPSAHALLCRLQLARSNPEAALREIQGEKEPFWRRFGLALTYHALGKPKEADAALRELIEKDQRAWAFQIAEVFAFRGQTDDAFQWLERAYSQRDAGLAEVKGEPLFKGLVGDPRYSALLKRLRLPL